MLNETTWGHARLKYFVAVAGLESLYWKDFELGSVTGPARFLTCKLRFCFFFVYFLFYFIYLILFFYEGQLGLARSRKLTGLIQRGP